MACRVFIDIYELDSIGQMVSAVAQGMARDFHDALTRHVGDRSWLYDEDALVSLVSHGCIGEVRTVNTVDIEPMIHKAEIRKYGLEVFDMAFHYRSHPSELSCKIRSALQRRRLENDIYCLVAGDAGYVPVAKQILAAGHRLILAFWSWGLSQELRDCADEYIDLNANFHEVTYRYGDKDMCNIK